LASVPAPDPNRRGRAIRGTRVVTYWATVSARHSERQPLQELGSGHRFEQQAIDGRQFDGLPTNLGLSIVRDNEVASQRGSP